MELPCSACKVYLNGVVVGKGGEGGDVCISVGVIK